MIDEIHKQFWSITDDNKNAFYESTTMRIPKKRSTVVNSRRNFTYNYCFNVEHQKITVCKKFYLATLDISQRRVQWFHEHVRDLKTGTIRTSSKGKTRKHRISEETLQSIRDHIRSVPTIESHYCRASTNKDYIDPSFSVQKMYDEYLIRCLENPEFKEKPAPFFKIS